MKSRKWPTGCVTMSRRSRSLMSRKPQPRRPEREIRQRKRSPRNSERRSAREAGLGQPFAERGAVEAESADVGGSKPVRHAEAGPRKVAGQQYALIGRVQRVATSKAR